MDYVPPLTGTAVGLADGVLGQLVQTKYTHTVFRLSVLGAGLFGALRGSWDPDLSYGLMTASAALIASRLPALVASGQLQALGQVQRAAPAAVKAAGCGCSGAGATQLEAVEPVTVRGLRTPRASLL